MTDSKIYVVGTGPGDIKKMTGQAYDVLLACDVIIGYGVYVDLIREAFPGKVFMTTPMTKEVARCEMAVQEALKGNTVAMVSGGDAGVYGMAGVLLEVAHKQNVEIEVVPGVTAALSGSAVLGAPLSNDFVVLSLSDLLTSWDVIEKRLEAAALGDFVIAIYNPGSRTRRDYLARACRILLRHKSPDTVVGMVRNIGREGESCRMMSLEELMKVEADMFTTVFVGNSQTKVVDGKMVTSRGYTVS